MYKKISICGSVECAGSMCVRHGGVQRLATCAGPDAHV